MKTCIKCLQTKLLSEFYQGSNRCKVCKIAYQKEYARNNVEKVRAYKKEHAKANADKIKTYQMVWRQANPEKKQACDKAWLETNRERKKANDRNWRESNPEKVRAHNKRMKAKRRALLLDITSTLTAGEWADIWADHDGMCFWCDATAEHMDHILPLNPRNGQLQGHHTKDNVVPACAPCNLSKGNKDPLTFYFEREPKPHTLAA